MCKCCRNNGKWILFALYLLIGIAGLIIFIMAVVNISNYVSGMDESDKKDVSEVIGIGFIILGLFMIATAILGCVGALKEIKWCILLAAAFLIVITIILLLAFIEAIDMADRAKKHKNAMNYWIKEKFDAVGKGDEDADNYYYNLQSTLRCCGYEGSHNYADSFLPKSCYAKDSDEPYEQGCQEAVEKAMQSTAVTAIILLLLFFFLTLITLILTYVLVGCCCC